MKITVDVKGLSALERELKSLTEDLRGKALYSALNQAATPILKEAKKRAAQAKEPHQMDYGGKRVEVRPGLLKSSLRKRRLRRKELAQATYSAAVGIYISKNNPQKLYPRYWHFIERGTSSAAAQPFLRPAFDAHKDEAVEIFKAKLAKNIEKYSKK